MWFRMHMCSCGGRALDLFNEVLTQNAHVAPTRHDHLSASQRVSATSVCAMVLQYVAAQVSCHFFVPSILDGASLSALRRRTPDSTSSRSGQAGAAVAPRCALAPRAEKVSVHPAAWAPLSRKRSPCGRPQLPALWQSRRLHPRPPHLRLLWHTRLLAPFATGRYNICSRRCSHSTGIHCDSNHTAVGNHCGNSSGFHEGLLGTDYVPCVPH